MRTPRLTEGGICARKTGSSALIASATSMVLVPGCRMTVRVMERSMLFGV